MYLYPSQVRRALRKLLKRGLDISRLSKSHARALLAHGVHGKLPSSLYDMAMSIDIQMVAFFHPSAVRVRDLLHAIANAKAVHAPLLDAARFHKHELLRRSDGFVLRRLIESDVVTSEDTHFLVRCRDVPPASLLAAKPALASASLDLSDGELDAVFSSVPREHWQTLYAKLDLSLPTVLRLAREHGVPPTHPALLQLQDPNVCLVLVLRFPNHPVLQFVAPHVKYRRDFARNVDLFVYRSLPLMYPHINSFLARALPIEYLVDKYRVKAYAMFDNAYYSIHRVDVRKLSKEDAAFVETNIGIYDVKAREFALRFRQHIQCTQNRTITMFVPGTLSHTWRRPKHATSVEDLLQHIDTLTDPRTSRPRTKDFNCVLEPHRYDMSLARRVLLSDVSTRTKKKALKAICRWKVSIGIGTQTVTATRCALVWNTYAHVTAKIFRIQSTLSDMLRTPMSKQQTLWCSCNHCTECRAFTRSPLPNLKNKILEDCAPQQEVTDDSLLTATHDLAVLASRGIVDAKFVSAEPGWGVIMSMLDNGSRIDHHRFRGVLTEESRGGR